jgi:type IV secretory pathway TrbF-like protein
MTNEFENHFARWYNKKQEGWFSEGGLVTTKRKNWKLNILRSIILALAIVSVIYGALHGELNAVLRKASMICLECIGIG